MHDFPEADWRILRDLARVALERFCRRVLEEAAPLVTAPEDPSKTYHERYAALFTLMGQRDKELAHTFNGLCRSTALIQLANMRQYQLLMDEEFMRFSQPTRERVQGILTIREA